LKKDPKLLFLWHWGCINAYTNDEKFLLFFQEEAASYLVSVTVKADSESATGRYAGR
jgi:hypothetical protein